MMLPYPFNKYGWYDKVEWPIRTFFWKLEAFKNISVDPWNCCNASDVVFAQFEFFCKKNPFQFVERFIRTEKNSYQYDDADDLWDDTINDLRRLMEIQEYVCYTRNLNKAVERYLEEVFMKYNRLFFVDRLKEKVCLYVDYEFIRGEIQYTVTVSKDPIEGKKTFNPLDLEESIDQMDKEYAKEIISLKDFLWC